MATNYRKKFMEHYCIGLSPKYAVHHIDFNRENNDIGNLMVMPRSLHNKYHCCVDLLTCPVGEDKTQRILDVRIGSTILQRNLSHDMLHELAETITECRKWYDFKMYMDGEMDNIHNLNLEE